MTTEKLHNDPCSPRQLGLPARHNIETIFKYNIAKSESTKKMMFLSGKAKGFSVFFDPKKLEEKKSNILPTEWTPKKKDGLRPRRWRVRCETMVNFVRNIFCVAMFTFTK